MGVVSRLHVCCERAKNRYVVPPYWTTDASRSYFALPVRGWPTTPNAGAAHTSVAAAATSAAKVLRYMKSLPCLWYSAEGLVNPLAPARASRTGAGFRVVPRSSIEGMFLF